MDTIEVQLALAVLGGVAAFVCELWLARLVAALLGAED